MVMGLKTFQDTETSLVPGCEAAGYAGPEDTSLRSLLKVRLSAATGFHGIRIGY